MLSNSSTKGVRRAAHGIFLLGFLFATTRLLATQGPAVTLAWDQSLDPTVSGYNVYYGTASRSYTNVVPVGSSTSATVSNLAVGVTYYFAATTYTLAGLESDYSAEASYQVPQPNNPPTLDTPADLAINQDSGLQVVPLTGITSGNANVIQTLIVSAFSSNPGLIPNPTVTYASPDTNGTLSFSPAAGSYGSAIITVMVDNGGAVSNTVIRTFTVTVNPVYNPPTIDLLSDVTISENAGPQTRNLTGITSGSTNGTPTLTVAAVSSNPGLIPNPAINYVSPATTGTLMFAPVTNVFGSARITITVSDNQPTNNSASMSFGVTVNQTVPAPGLLTNAIIAPNTIFRFIVTPPATNGDKFNMSLASGAPAGAKLGTSRKGANWLTWTPTMAQASTTNLIGIKITDTSNPALSTNETLQVIVLDYLSVALGSTSIQAGQSGTLPLVLSSSDGVTNLSFAIAWPTNSLPNPALSPSASGIASSSLRNQGSNVLVTIQMSPGQVLQGSNVIGSLSFQSLATQASGYINLPISSLSAVKPNAVPYSVAVPKAGQVAIINSLAMLQATTSATPARSLTILGKVGNNYQVQYCTNFGAAAVWYPLGTYSQTNISQTITVDPTLSQVLYRVQQK
jgi:hypothetical protein